MQIHARVPRSALAAMMLISTSGCLPPLPVDFAWEEAGELGDGGAEFDGDGGAEGSLSAGGTDAGDTARSSAGTASTAGTAGTDVRLFITEIHPDPEGADGGPMSPEFVEVLNDGPSPVPLDRLTLRARGWPIVDAARLGGEGLGLQLAPGARWVVHRYADSGVGNAPQTVPWGLTSSFSSSSGMRNADGSVVLEMDGVLQDALAYGAQQPPPLDALAVLDAPSSGMSLCPRSVTLCSPSPGQPQPTAEESGTGSATSSGTDETSGDAESADAGDGLTTSTTDIGDAGATSGTAGVETAGPGTGTSDAGTGSSSTGEPPQVLGPPTDLAIVEVLANPVGPASGEKALEFVEILNAGTDPVSLENLWLADDLAAAAPGTDPLEWRAGESACADQLCLGAGERAIVTGNAYTGESAGMWLVVDDTTLADGGLTSIEPVVLLDDVGNPLSTYRAWGEPDGHPNPRDDERSLRRLEADRTDEPANWEFADPTPGS